MNLRSKQSLFLKLVARLLLHAELLGYEMTFGNAFRSHGEAKRLGFEGSLHTKRLAIDLNLFKDGKYLRETADFEQLGIWWEQQHELCRWGGRFDDGNHFSLEHGGRK